MKFRRATATTVARDLRLFGDEIAYAQWDQPSRSDIAQWLNKKLDELVSMDAFGTEGQRDPRGDHRN